MEKTYLGDGVYASFDGYHVVLECEGKIIYLDPGVVSCLETFIEGIRGGNDGES